MRYRLGFHTRKAWANLFTPGFALEEQLTPVTAHDIDDGRRADLFAPAEIAAVPLIGRISFQSATRFM
jgi:hypothetical protein